MFLCQQLPHHLTINLTLSIHKHTAHSRTHSVLSFDYLSLHNKNYEIPQTNTNTLKNQLAGTSTLEKKVGCHMHMASNNNFGFYYGDSFVLAIVADWQTNKKGLQMQL